MTPATAEAKLAKLKREVRREWRRRAAPVRAAFARVTRRPAADLARAALVALLKTAAIIALPFVLLVRASVYYYEHVGLDPWTALLAGAVLALLVVTGYAAWLSRRLTGRMRFITMLKWVALPLVAGWCLDALLFVGGGNVKNDAVRSYYTAVHPILRVALSTVILVDRRLVVTDFARRPEDYARMGLPVYDRTLHYVQRDGWVHAVDLRTQGHGEVKNRAVQLYFWIMGFDTLRHVGTADHLHVELALRL